MKGSPGLRVGTGYDIHVLVPDLPLVIGGVTIPSARGARAHSDGDVLIHAVIDALLGATADGDIGSHFPPSDEKYRDICSRDLLRDVANRLREGGTRIVNVDATVVLESPRLGPHIPAARTNLAEDLSIDAATVSIKAKTNEGIGVVGQGEAVACHAVVLVQHG